MTDVEELAKRLRLIGAYFRRVAKHHSDAILQFHCERDAKTTDEAESLLRSQHQQIEVLSRLLGDMHAMVLGECPSLLNEDSGGDARLDLDIRAALKGDEQ